MTTQDAMDLALAAGLQLVEVNPKAVPPVCKIMDYGKFKYETAKRERDAKKNQKTSEVKEVKFRPKTHEHDFDFKLRHIRRFLGEGDKVRLVVQFRGREIIHPETGRVGVPAAKVDGVTAREMCRIEGRNRDAFGLKFRERREETVEILRVGEDEKVDVFAKLRRAVQHACLPPPISSART